MNYQPIDPGGASPSYLAFRDNVQTKLDHVEARIRGAIEDARRNWSDSLVGSSVTALVPSAGLGSAYSAAKLDQVVQDIWDAFSEASVKIWEKAGQLTGDPDTLMELNRYYYAAATRLVDEREAIQRMVRSVSKHWQGIAFASYEGLAGEQCDAIDAICSGFKDAAEACSDGASQLRDIRNRALERMLQYAEKIAHVIDEATDVGKMLTMEVGPVTEAIANLAIEVAEICNDLATFYGQNLTAGTDAWRRLNSGLPGLTGNNDWPTLGADDMGDIRQHHSWDPV